MLLKIVLLLYALTQANGAESTDLLSALPPCEVLFPKQGDFLLNSGNTYNLLMCHFSSETEEILKKTNRKLSVVIHVLFMNTTTMQYSKEFEYAPINLVSPEQVPNEPSPKKLTDIFELFFRLPAYRLDVRYKFVYQVMVDDLLVDQVATVVTYKSDDYFRSLLGVQKIDLVDVSVLCEEEENGECSLLNMVRNGLFTEQFDFIEIGTSAFDTVIQSASPLHRGISVEPVTAYLDRLPSPPGVIKENAAIDVKQSDSGEGVGPFGVMYSQDPSALEAHGFSLTDPLSSHLFGLSSLGTIQTNLLNAYRLEGKYAATPSIFLQQSRVVPRLSMEELYVKHSVREVGFLKLDCEGLDLLILASYLRLLEKFLLPAPCVIAVEVLCVVGDDFLSTVRDLEEKGYRVMSVARPRDEAVAGDFLAVHSQCSAETRKHLKNLLPRKLEAVEGLCGGGEGYCCVTEHDAAEGAENQIELCDELQPFFVEQ